MPAGFTAAGRMVVAEGNETGRLHVTILDRATGQPTPCRVNVVGSDGNFYQPRQNPLSAYSLIHAWPEGLAGNRPGKAPIRYFGHFFYTPGKFTVEVPAGPVRMEVWKGLEYRVEMHSTHVVVAGERDVLSSFRAPYRCPNRVGIRQTHICISFAVATRTIIRSLICSKPRTSVAA